MVTEDRVMDALRLVIDPEIGINIVDLGLIYNLIITDNSITVIMTLTTPGCPMHSSLAGGVEHAVKNLDINSEVKVELVWEPKWIPDMMSDKAKQHLGHF